MGWIGFDIDGTLAIDLPNRSNDTEIGEPIQPMVDKARELINQGKDVRIFSARAFQPDLYLRTDVYHAIRKWCIKHIGRPLPIVYYKDHNLDWYYDDKAIAVEYNTGKILKVINEEEPDNFIGLTD